MKRSIGFALLMSVASCGAFATELTGQSCRPVHALLIESRDTENCQVSFCNSGTIEGNRGLNGTTHLELDGGAPGPDTAPGWRTATGLQTITTRDGTLVLRVVGIFKISGTPSNGVEAAGFELVSATGRFEGATGEVFAATRIVNGVFNHTITGTLCLNRRHTAE